MTAKILTVVSGKGGVGKSTFAVNFAIDAALKGKHVMLIDAEEKGGSSDYQYREDELDNLIIKGGFERTMPRWLDREKDSYDLIVIDTAGVDTSPDASREELQKWLNHQAIIRSDLLLVPIEPSPVTLRKYADYLSSIQSYVEMSRGNCQALICLNKFVRGQEISEQLKNQLADFADNFGLSHSKNFIRTSVQVQKADGLYQSVNEYNSSCDIALDFRHLEKEVFSLLGLE